MTCGHFFHCCNSETEDTDEPSPCKSLPSPYESAGQFAGPRFRNWNLLKTDSGDDSASTVHTYAVCTADDAVGSSVGFGKVYDEDSSAQNLPPWILVLVGIRVSGHKVLFKLDGRWRYLLFSSADICLSLSR